MLSSFAQKGDFLLTNHSPRHSNLDNSNFEITSDSHGRLCIANRAGILKYDGEAWDYYKTPSAALSIAVDLDDVVYVGCVGEVGRIDYRDRQFQYTSIFKTDTINDLFLETKYMSGKVYFMGSDNLIVYDILEKEAKHHTGRFINIYEIDNEMFVNTSDNETLLINDSLSVVKPEKKVAYASKKENRPDLIIGYDNSIYSYTDFGFSLLPQNQILVDMGFEAKELMWLNDTLFACSTFEDGIVLFNLKDPKYYQVTNNSSGLPDNEIYTIHTDESNGIWAAHQFGISHIAPLFPAHSYSHFNGLDGNLTSVFNRNKALWVTTSSGLYYFDSDTIFENKVYYEIKRKTKRQPTQKAVNQEKDKPVLKRLFGKKNRARTQGNKKKGFLNSIAEIFENDNNVVKVKGRLDKNARYVRKVRKVPVDINYSFTKVTGANGKFLDILSYKNKLLGISATGVYEFTTKDAHSIISENIRSYMVSSNGQLILSTAELDVKAYTLNDEIWIEQSSSPMHDIIVSMEEDDEGNIWMAGSGSIYKAHFEDTVFTIKDKYVLDNIFLDEVNILKRQDTLFFINNQGYFYHDSGDNTVKENPGLKARLGQPVHHLFDREGKSIWVYNGKVWSQLKEDGAVETIEYLGLFPDLRSISLNKKENRLWLTTGNNEVLSYDPAMKGGMESFNFFLKRVSNERGELNQSKKFTLSYDENFLNIELSKPDFLGLLNPEFQYKLQGLHTEWSDWSKSKSIDFSFLPEGNYALRVRARDAFGRTEEGEVLKFSVRPPYWQTPWFYAIQILIFGALVYYSTKLNQDSSKNRLLRGGLTLLTLVLIIEFLQSTIGSLFSFKSTPVIDFLLDASIAFMIFPLERLLRELMTQGKVKVKINKGDIPLVRKDRTAK